MQICQYFLLLVCLFIICLLLSLSFSSCDVCDVVITKRLYLAYAKNIYMLYLVIHVYVWCVYNTSPNSVAQCGRGTGLELSFLCYVPDSGGKEFVRYAEHMQWTRPGRCVIDGSTENAEPENDGLSLVLGPTLFGIRRYHQSAIFIYIYFTKSW